MKGVAIVGAGKICGYHILGWKQQDDAYIRLIVDIDENLAKAKAEPLKADYCTDYREIFKRDDIEVVSVALPHYLHKPVVCDLLKNGMHVLVEKPIALTIEEAEAMDNTAKECNRKLAVAENWRYNKVIEEAARIVKKGEIGEPYMIRSHMEFWEKDRIPEGSWYFEEGKTGGGVAFESGIHVVSVARRIMGEVSSVYGLKGKSCWDELSPMEDNFIMGLRFKDGSIGVLSFCWLGKKPGFHCPFVVLGTEGVLEFNFQGGTYEFTTISVWTGDVNKQISVKSSPTMGFVEMARHFLDCINNDSEPITSAEEEMKSLQVILAGYESVKKEKPIELNKL
jgi:predicted dehydrogenase